MQSFFLLYSVTLQTSGTYNHPIFSFFCECSCFLPFRDFEVVSEWRRGPDATRLTKVINHYSFGYPLGESTNSVTVELTTVFLEIENDNGMDSFKCIFLTVLHTKMMNMNKPDEGLNLYEHNG